MTIAEIDNINTVEILNKSIGIARVELKSWVEY